MPEVQYAGRIDVSPRAIASIASQAVLGCYGVVGVAVKDVPTGVANFLRDDTKRGIVVRVEDGEIYIDVYIVVEYGTRVAAVARSVMNVVEYRVERALGMSVAEVNVHVEDLRVSNAD